MNLAIFLFIMVGNDLMLIWANCVGCISMAFVFVGLVLLLIYSQKNRLSIGRVSTNS